MDPVFKSGYGSVLKSSLFVSGPKIVNNFLSPLEPDINSTAMASRWPYCINNNY